MFSAVGEYEVYCVKKQCFAKSPWPYEYFEFVVAGVQAGNLSRFVNVDAFTENQIRKALLRGIFKKVHGTVPILYIRNTVDYTSIRKYILYVIPKKAVLDSCLSKK